MEILNKSSERGNSLLSVIIAVAIFGGLAKVMMSMLGNSSQMVNHGKQKGDDSSNLIDEKWKDYCQATFVKDYSVQSSFGDTLFEVKKGDIHLISGFSIRGDKFEMIKLTEDGKKIFEIEDTSLFTSTCTEDNSWGYSAVFHDTEIYEDAELKNKVCTLKSGTVKQNGYFGYGAYGESIYSITLEEFAVECNIAKGKYFVKASPFKISDVTFVGLNVDSILKKN